VPNCDARHKQLRDEFTSRYSQMDNVCSSYVYVNVEIVETCIRNLKRGKAAGLDGLTAEHIIYSHPIVAVLQTLLFNIMLIHGVVPDAFGIGIVIPLLKNVDGNKTSTDNYRGITLSPVIGKIFESVMLQLFSSHLESDSLQYGFKQNSSCSHAIFTLHTVLDHYVKSGSTVTICALDISKAFDRVDHFALLKVLIDKELPKTFASVSYGPRCLK